MGERQGSRYVACLPHVIFGFEGLFGFLLVGSFVCSCVFFRFEGLRVQGFFGYIRVSSCRQFCLFM
jgi:hypothetical protein